MGEISKTACREIADRIEAYLNFVESFFCIENLTKEEYDFYMKKARKAVKDLRKGKYEKYIDEGKYMECMLNDEDFRRMMGSSADSADTYAAQYNRWAESNGPRVHRTSDDEDFEEEELSMLMGDEE